MPTNRGDQETQVFWAVILLLRVAAAGGVLPVVRQQALGLGPVSRGGSLRRAGPRWFCFCGRVLDPRQDWQIAAQPAPTAPGVRRRASSIAMTEGLASKRLLEHRALRGPERGSVLLLALMICRPLLVVSGIRALTVG
jgi:hypothetical protein